MKRPSGSDTLLQASVEVRDSLVLGRCASAATEATLEVRRPPFAENLEARASVEEPLAEITLDHMPIDDAATRTLRAAGLGFAPRNERLAELAGLRRSVDTGSYRLGFHPSGRPAATARRTSAGHPTRSTPPQNVATHRYCARPTCSREAVATMSYDQRECTVFLGGLSPERDPAFYDLCRVHVDRLTPPTGWTIRRVRPTAVGDDGTDETAATLDGWSSPSPSTSAADGALRANRANRADRSSVVG